MAPSNLGYSVRDALKHFFRNWTTSFGAAIGNVEDQVTINAFISDEASDSDVEAFMEKLESWDNVKKVEFKTKEDALADYSQNVSDNADATMAALDGNNPLPRSYSIEMEDPSQVEAMANKIKDDPDFQKIVDDSSPDSDDLQTDLNESVIYGQKEVSRLFQLTNYIRIAAVVLVALLTFVAFIFINNTIRLSITARRREIAIMRLVGASNGFIRGPFIIEGMIQALLGALLSIGSLELIRNLVIPQVASGISFMSFSVPMQIYYITYGSLVLLGLIIGLFGSMIAMRRYLKV